MLTAHQDGGPQWTITADICREGSGGSRNMRFYLAEALNDRPNPPEHSRNLLMQAPQTKDLSLSGGECTQIQTLVTFDATSIADQNNIVVISWAQAPSASGPAEVYQGAVMKWPFPESPQLDRIEISPQDVTLEEGESVDFAASGFDQFGNDSDLSAASWDLSGEGSGTLSPQSGPTTRFSATGAGVVELKCSLGAVSGVASVQINPHVPVLGRIRIEPSSAEMMSGDVLHFRASGVDQYGEDFALENPEWRVEGGCSGDLDPTVGSAETTFTPSNEGSCLLYCREGDLETSVDVDVLPAGLPAPKRLRGRLSSSP